MKGMFIHCNRSCAYIIACSLAALPAGNAMAQSKYASQKGAFLPEEVHVLSTVPSNGDLNPYGVAFVPEYFPVGSIKPGDILVSNFNNNLNLQGTGSSIVKIGGTSSPSIFFQGNGLLGLTGVLHVLKKGLVLVGAFPSIDGTCGTASTGSILVLQVPWYVLI